MWTLTNPAGTADKLELTSDTGADLDTFVCFSDYLSTNTPPVSESNEGNSFTIAQTNQEICAGPGTTGQTRVMTIISIVNVDASLACTVTLKINKNGTRQSIGSFALGHGDILTWTKGTGWFVYTSTTLLDQTVMLTADVVNATTSLADVTGLSIAVKQGHKYAFTAVLFSVNNASTTGSQFAVNGPTMTNFVVTALGTVTPSVTAAAVSEGEAAAVNTIISADTTGSTSVRVAYISGAAEPSADGSLVVRAASEVAVAAGITVKRGSWFAVQEASN